MAESLEIVWQFISNVTFNQSFLHKLEVVLVDKAVDLRSQDEPPGGSTYDRWCARQQWANQVMQGYGALSTLAARMLPALTKGANDAGKLKVDDGVPYIDATDEQIIDFITDDVIDWHMGYTPPEA